MKARGLFFGGLLITALLVVFQMGMLNDFILTLPEENQLLLDIWILDGKIVDWTLLGLFTTLVGLFSLTLKKKEEF
jgi:hypothetical protein